MSQRDRERRPARRAAFLDVKPVVLVVCEGAITEPEYLEGFAKACHNARVRIEIHGGKGVPKSIVEFARDRKRYANIQAKRENDDNLSYDEVWCVFDIDEHPNVPNAKEMARDNGLKLAISNPCIEIWLWLHFADQPGMQHRHALQRMMIQHVPGYDKHVDFADDAVGYETAVRRAQKMDSAADLENDSGRNPTTGMWQLTESIRSNS